MSGYSTYGMTNFQRTAVQTIDDPLQAKYTKLLELRERVTRAEARRATQGQDKAACATPGGCWAQTFGPITGAHCDVEVMRHARAFF